MKRRFRFIHMVEKPAGWLINNNRSGETIGAITWYPAWNRFVFVAPETSVWSSDCLRDVAGFMEQLPPRPTASPQRRGDERRDTEDSEQEE